MLPSAFIGSRLDNSARVAIGAGVTAAGLPVAVISGDRADGSPITLTKPPLQSQKVDPKANAAQIARLEAQAAELREQIRLANRMGERDWAAQARQELVQVNTQLNSLLAAIRRDVGPTAHGEGRYMNCAALMQTSCREAPLSKGAVGGPLTKTITGRPTAYCNTSLRSSHSRSSPATAPAPSAMPRPDVRVPAHARGRCSG